MHSHCGLVAKSSDLCNVVGRLGPGLEMLKATAPKGSSILRVAYETVYGTKAISNMELGLKI